MNYPVTPIIVGAVLTYIICTIVGSLISKSSFPLPCATNRNECIDGLRGYLALSVLIHHFIIWLQVSRLGGSWAEPSVNLFNHLGSGSVSLFFMATGFVFYPKVLTGFKDCYWPTLYINRIFRIIPLVMVSVAIITGVIFFRTGNPIDANYPFAALKWITSLGTPRLLKYPDSGRINAYVLWSLKFEWIFYLVVLPICATLMDFIKTKYPSWLLPIVLVAVAMSAKLLHIRLGIFILLPIFASGMIAYELQRSERISRQLRRPLATVLASAAFLIGMVGPYQPYGYSAPLFGFFFACVASGNSIFGLLRTRGSLILGECSYGLYLIHGIVLSIVFVDCRTITDSISTEYLPILIPIIGAATTIATAITYILVERPAIRGGRALAKHWTIRRSHCNSP